MTQIAAEQAVGGRASASTVGGRRLIEEWLPIAAIGEESMRERRSMTALPPTYYLHVWWARRPLVASRAAILASLLPADADHDQFLHLLGIHGDPVAAREKMDRAGRNIDAETGKREDLGPNPYGYDRAFKYLPTQAERLSLEASAGVSTKRVLDPTAGGGSIPFEALRLGATAIANDLNPVAWLLLKATVEFPSRFGPALVDRYRQLSARFIALASPRFEGIFGPEAENVTVDGYLWARTITCPYCGGLVPLSPNWRLNSRGVGVRFIPVTDPKHQPELAMPGLADRRHARFEIVHSLAEHSPGTVSGGDGKCPFPDCGRVFANTEIQAQAHAGKMGEQLYSVVYREHRVVGYTAGGKPKIKKLRGFRAPRTEDDVAAQVQAALDARMSEWQARGIMPDEEIPHGHKTGDDTRAADKYRKGWQVTLTVAAKDVMQFIGNHNLERRRRGTKQ